MATLAQVNRDAHMECFEHWENVGKEFLKLCLVPDGLPEGFWKSLMLKVVVEEIQHFGKVQFAQRIAVCKERLQIGGRGDRWDESGADH